jgi:hypothetical protein
MKPHVRTDIRGAIYIPSRAWNAWQMWHDFDATETRRDMGYARSVSLNAVRVWLSYEYWQEAPNDFEQKFDGFLTACGENGVLVMPSLFENCGVPFTPEAARETDPFKAFALFSPGPDVVGDRSLWEGPHRFVRWFMDRFRSDERLLAIELMNEPHFKKDSMEFAVDMLRTAVQNRGGLPLTMGSLGRSVYHNLPFALEGADVFQYHLNFPRTIEEFEKELQNAKLMETITGRPVWITEWQRIRAGGSGWVGEGVSGSDWEPALSTLAPLVSEYGVGSFFWSLMVKPAYLPAQRPKGTLNGLFHEDGSVYSLADARAIARDPALDLVERRSWPEWCRAIGIRSGVIGAATHG